MHVSCDTSTRLDRARWRAVAGVGFADDLFEAEWGVDGGCFDVMIKGTVKGAAGGMGSEAERKLGRSAE